MMAHSCTLRIQRALTQGFSVFLFFLPFNAVFLAMELISYMRLENTVLESFCFCFEEDNFNYAFSSCFLEYFH